MLCSNNWHRSRSHCASCSAVEYWLPCYLLHSIGYCLVSGSNSRCCSCTSYVLRCNLGKFSPGNSPFLSIVDQNVAVAMETDSNLASSAGLRSDSGDPTIVWPSATLPSIPWSLEKVYAIHTLLQSIKIQEILCAGDPDNRMALRKENDKRHDASKRTETGTKYWWQPTWQISGLFGVQILW